MPYLLSDTTTKAQRSTASPIVWHFCVLLFYCPYSAVDLIELLIMIESNSNNNSQSKPPSDYLKLYVQCLLYTIHFTNAPTPLYSMHVSHSCSSNQFHIVRHAMYFWTNHCFQFARI